MFCTAVFAQNNQIESTFTQEDQSVTTRNWNTRFSLNKAVNLWNITVTSNVNISERILDRYEPRWENIADLKFNSSKKLNDNFEFVFETSGQDIRDHEAKVVLDKLITPNRPFTYLPDPILDHQVIGRNSQTQRGVFRSGVQFIKPELNFKAHFLSGQSLDNRLNTNGNGPSGRYGFSWQSPWEDELSIDGDGWYDRFGDRQNHEIFLTGQTTRKIGEGFDRLTVSWANDQSDLLRGNSGNFSRRKKADLLISNNISTLISNFISGSYDLSYQRSNINEELREHNDLYFIHDFQFKGIKDNYFGEFGYTYSIEDIEDLNRLQLGRRQILSLLGGWSADRDSVTIDYNTQKMSYNSPENEITIDDRDRLVHRIRTRGSFWMFQNTRYSIDLFLLLDHIVNLSSEKSGNNRWNRVIRLNNCVDWVPTTKVRNRAFFEVLANYTIYDFELSEQPSSIKSNVLRMWSVSDTLSLPLTENMLGIFSGRYDIEDRGRMRWDDFVQEVSNETHAWYTNISMERHFWSKLYIQFGYRFQRSEKDRFDLDVDNNIIKSRDLTYILSGPHIRLKSKGWNNIQLAMDVMLLDVEDSQPNGLERIDTFKISFRYAW
jgi:hypothetical protein